MTPIEAIEEFDESFVAPEKANSPIITNNKFNGSQDWFDERDGTREDLSDENNQYEDEVPSNELESDEVARI